MGMKVLEVGCIEWQDQSINGAIITGTLEQLKEVAAIMLNDRGGSIVVSDASDPLQAAAPDMLKALRMIVAYDNMVNADGVGMMLSYAAALDAAHDAIAKAEGAGE